MLPIPGTSRIDHLEENVAAAAIRRSSPAELDGAQSSSVPERLRVGHRRLAAKCSQT